MRHFESFDLIKPDPDIERTIRRLLKEKREQEVEMANNKELGTERLSCAIHISSYILHYQADYSSQQLRVEDRCHTIGVKHMPIWSRIR